MTGTNKSLKLNRRRRIFLGVCSGFGEYFGIEPLFIRIAYLVAIFTWAPAILVYFICYFIMNKDGDSIDELKSTVVNSKVGRHLKNVDYKKRLYKNAQNKRIAGVCSGFADYFEISAFFIRLALLGSLFFGPFAILAYIAAAILMDKNPNDGPSSDRRYFHDRMHPHMSDQARETIKEKVRMAEEHMNARKRKHSRHDDMDNAKQFNKQDMEKCARRFSELEQKLRKLEATITSKKFKLHRELKRMQDGTTA